MKRLLAFLALVISCGLSSAATYQYSTSNYLIGNITNFTACNAGACGTFTTQMNVTGSFTTAVPLPANFGGTPGSGTPLGDLTMRVGSFSFFDGVTTYSNTDTNNVRVINFFANTDNTGAITDFEFQAIRWQGPAPHNVNTQFDQIVVNGRVGGTTTQVWRNISCGRVDNAPVPDVCGAAALNGPERSTATALSNTITLAPAAPTVTSVPTVSELGLMLLSGMLALGGLVMIRRKRF